MKSEVSSLQAFRRKARIEIIPLIDVVFFLLATFVLFTLSLEKLAVIQLPQPVPGEPRDALDETLYLQATGRGGFLWKLGRVSASELVSADELSARLVNYRQTVRQPRIFVSGDSQVKYGATIRLIDEVRKAKIDQVSLETSPQSSFF